jgi:hypothetical protein
VCGIKSLVGGNTIAKIVSLWTARRGKLRRLSHRALHVYVVPNNRPVFTRHGRVGTAESAGSTKRKLNLKLNPAARNMLSVAVWGDW